MSKHARRHEILYWEAGIFVSRGSLRTRSTATDDVHRIGYAYLSFSLARECENADARVINRGCRNNRPR